MKKIFCFRLKIIAECTNNCVLALRVFLFRSGLGVPPKTDSNMLLLICLFICLFICLVMYWRQLLNQSNRKLDRHLSLAPICCRTNSIKFRICNIYKNIDFLLSEHTMLIKIVSLVR